MISQGHIGVKRMGLWIVAVCLLACSIPAWAGALPDGRRYEMVTPAENHEADVYVPLAVAEDVVNSGPGDTRTRLPFQVSANGGAVTYVGDVTVGGIGDGGAGLGNQYLARRGPDGLWSQIVLQPDSRRNAFYQGFTSDLSTGFLNAGFEEMEASPLTSEGGWGGYPILYTHNNGYANDSGYHPLFINRPTEPAEGFHTYSVPTIYPYVGPNWLVYAGASSNLGEILFEVDGALTVGATPGLETNNLYVASPDDGLNLVNVLPGGTSDGDATFGAPRLSSGNSGDPPDFENVISANGSRIFWTDLSTTVDAENPTGVPRLFMREDPTSSDARTVQLDVSHGPGSSGGGRFWTAASDGSWVLFTDESQLTPNSTAAPEAADLYEYDVENGRLSDLTVDPHGGEAAAVQGVVGTSEDGSYVYFVAHGVLASNKNSEGTEAVGGEDNLYVLRQGQEPKFIATLSANDNERALEIPGPNGHFGDWQPGLGHRTAEVTPDGGSIVFESNNQELEGYSPEVEGTKLEEMYVYKVAGEELFCVSCGASHEVPETNEESSLGIGGFPTPSWSVTYLPHWMSDDGSRVFFNSAEPLTSEDTDGTQDVYEWQRDGVGGCLNKDGCVSLLSGGSSPAASWLVGSSASGDDMFFISRSKLTPGDGNEAFNLFDARVGGISPVTPPACSGTGCQGLPAPPPVFATPPSITFGGVGNFSHPVKGSTKGKRKHTKQKKKKSTRHKTKSKKVSKPRGKGGRHTKRTKTLVDTRGGSGR
jgi:hypothetical protein